jgi:hypothetical protein
VGGFLVHTVPHGTIWSSVYVNIQERKMAIRISLHNELDFGMDVVRKFLSSLGPWDHITKCVIHVTEQIRGLEGHPTE